MDEPIQIKQQESLTGNLIFTVPAIGLQQPDGNWQLIPNPYGQQAANFQTLDEALEAIFHAGYDGEIQGRRYNRPLANGQQSRPVPQTVPKRGWEQEWEACQQALIEALEDRESAVVVAAIQALGELKDQRLNEALLPLMQEEEGDVRQAVAMALARQGLPLLPMLLEQLELANSMGQQAGFRQRLTVLATLQELGRAYTAEQLHPCLPYVRELLRDKHWLVRQQAALALKQLAVEKAGL